MFFYGLALHSFSLCSSGPILPLQILGIFPFTLHVAGGRGNQPHPLRQPKDWLRI